MWFAIFIVGTLFLMVGLALLRWKEDKYLKKSTKEAMRAEFRHEIEQEERDTVRRKKKFEKDLTKFDN